MPLEPLRTPGHPREYFRRGESGALFERGNEGTRPKKAKLVIKKMTVRGRFPLKRRGYSSKSSMSGRRRWEG